jgi:hypothetical protein
MKLTKSKLKQIIKEELKKVINESSRTEMRYRDNFENGVSPGETARQMYENYDDIEFAQEIASNLSESDPELASYIRRVVDVMGDIRSDSSDMFDEPDRYGGSRYGRYEEGKLAKSSKKGKTK